MEKENINVLIIGGLGFIGWNFTKYLLSSGKFNINIVDKKKAWFSDYYVDDVYVQDSTFTQSNRFSWSDSENFYIDDGMYFEEPDAVFHFGEFSRVEKSLESKKDFAEVIENNIMGTANVLLKYISKMNNPLFFYAGSSTRFSYPNAYKQTPYAFTKYSNAELVKNLHNWFGYKTGIIYFYNVFGENENDGDMGTVVGKFKDNWFEKRKIDVYGGMQTRRFTYVGDVVRNLTNLLLSSLETGLKGDEFHMVAPSVREVSIDELSRLFYDDEKMINCYPMKSGCRMQSVDNKTLAKVKCYGRYETSVAEYVDAFKKGDVD